MRFEIFQYRKKKAGESRETRLRQYNCWRGAKYRQITKGNCQIKSELVHIIKKAS